MNGSSDAGPGAPVEATPAAGAPAVPRIPGWVVVLGVLVVLAGVALRFVTTSALWLDETLTVNIARLPLSQLQDALKHDGAPPLYYVLLHGWTSLFGAGNLAARSLAGVISVLTLPVVWCCGRRLGRPGAPGRIVDDPPSARLVAGLSVIVLATSPFAIRYATESRMYSLVMLEVALGYLALRRALERPSLGRLALAALLVGAMLYTQYWLMFLLVVVGLGVLVRAVRGPSPETRHAARGVIVSMVAGLILFVPWIPTFLYQQSHTGTPWGRGEVPYLAIREAIDQFANGTSVAHAQANVLVFILVVLVLLGAFGAARDRHRIELDVRTQPTVRWEFVGGLVALVLAVSVSWVTDRAFDPRYASIVFPLFVLVVAVGLVCFASRPVMACLVVLVVALGFAGAAYNVKDGRTQAEEIATVIDAKAKPGDVVVYCPDQVGPAVDRLLRARGLTQITFPNFDAAHQLDWVDYRDRVAATDPQKFAQRVADTTGTDHAVWFVYNAGYENFQEPCSQLYAALAAQYPGAVDELRADDRFFEAANVVRFGASR